jgi:hypothetical protein
MVFLSYVLKAQRRNPIISFFSFFLYSSLPTRGVEVANNSFLENFLLSRASAKQV